MNDFPLPTVVAFTVMLTGALQVTNYSPSFPSIPQYTQHGEPFTDPDFPPTNKSLYIDAKKPISKWHSKVGKWERPLQARSPYGSGMTKWTVVREPRPDNVAQGELGNCWYVYVALELILLPIA